MTINQRQLAKKLDKLFSFMPGAFRDKTNFKTLMGAIAESDCELDNLFLEVRKQLFVETASGTFLDKLGSNVGVERPPLIGMMDGDYREFIKLQTYYPKQIRQLLTRLMELFYGRDTIKASIRTEAVGPYRIFDGATLSIRIDGSTVYDVTFSSSSFNDPNSVTVQEIAAQINAQVPDAMFASTYFNAIDKLEYLELFTNTFGPVGSIEVVGGSANRFLKFPSTNIYGATILSQYRIVKSSVSTVLYWAGGDNPLFSEILPDDKLILTGNSFLTSNIGSFTIEQAEDTGIPAVKLLSTSAVFVSPNVVRYYMPSTEYIESGHKVIIDGFSNASNNGTFDVLSVAVSYIDLQTNRIDNTDDEAGSGTVDTILNASYISYVNPDGVSQDSISVLSVDDVLFFRSTKKKLESSKRPATVWEIDSNEIIITLPATPVIVRRNLAGSAHVQGTSALISKTFTGSMELVNADYFPVVNGSFYLQKSNGVVLTDQKYTYQTRNGTTILGITPIPRIVGNNIQLKAGPLSTITSSNIIQVTSTNPHGLAGGELIEIKNFDGFAGLSASDINGVRSVVSIIDEITFTFTADNAATSTSTNYPTVGKGEIFVSSGSKIVITNIQQNSGYVGSFIYDPKNAKYTISEMQTALTQNVLLGEFGGSLLVSNSNSFPDTSGQVVINYGREDEEGPIRYIAKPGNNSIFIDPSYRFKKSHSNGAVVSLIRYNYATSVDPLGKLYPVYIVDTVGPREKLKELLLDAKAAGVSVRFIVILPENVYNAYSLYELES